MFGWKISIIMIALVVNMGVFGQSAWADGNEKATGQTLVAILPLQGEVTQGFGDLSDSVYQRVMSALFKTKRFEFVERAQLSTILGELQRHQTGLFDNRSAIRLGKQLGASTVVVGSYKANMMRENRGNGIILQPADIELNLRFVNVKTGKIENIFKTSALGTASNLMDKLSDKLDREISNLYPMTGYVIKVLNEREAVIDLGSNDGVVEGNEFNVIEYGEDIVHPKTKKIIKGEKRLVNVLEVINVAGGTAVVKVTGASQAPIKVGFEIESKPKKAGFWESVQDSLK